MATTRARSKANNKRESRGKKLRKRGKEREREKNLKTTVKHEKSLSNPKVKEAFIPAAATS